MEGRDRIQYLSMGPAVFRVGLIQTRPVTVRQVTQIGSNVRMSRVPEWNSRVVQMDWR